MKNEHSFAAIMAILVILAVCGVALIQPNFLSSENIFNILRQSVPLLILAVAQTFPLVSRGLDLSQGGVVVATGVTYALLAQSLGTETAIPLSFLVGLVVGAINGGLIAGLGLSPLVVTLGIGSILQGIALVAASGQPVYAVPADFSLPYYGGILGVPLPLFIALAMAAVGSVILDRTLLGRRIRAVGSNSRAAYLSGLPVKSTVLLAYLLSAGFTSIGGIMLAARISSGHPTAGSDLALQAIAAAVIGGVSLFGGRGKIIGACLGALFLTSIANALNLLNVSSFIQLIAAGLIIIVAVVIDKTRRDAVELKRDF